VHNKDQVLECKVRASMTGVLALLLLALHAKSVESGSSCHCKLKVKLAGDNTSMTGVLALCCWLGA
jgi:hypothetical protein